MSDANDPLEWARYAEEDFRVAKSVLRKKKPPTHIAAFHAQQSCEKYLKALLLSKGITFPKIHDLLALDSMCIEAGVFVGVPSKVLGRLTEYAVHTRYPGVELTLEEAHDAIEIAQSVRKFARSFLGLEK